MRSVSSTPPTSKNTLWMSPANRPAACARCAPWTCAATTKAVASPIAIWTRGCTKSDYRERSAALGRLALGRGVGRRPVGGDVMALGDEDLLLGSVLAAEVLLVEGHEVAQPGPAREELRQRLGVEHRGVRRGGVVELVEVVGQPDADADRIGLGQRGRRRGRRVDPGGPCGRYGGNPVEVALVDRALPRVAILGAVADAGVRAGVEVFAGQA